MFLKRRGLKRAGIALLILMAAGCTSPLDLLPTATATVTRTAAVTVTTPPANAMTPVATMTAERKVSATPAATQRKIPTMSLLLRTATVTPTKKVTPTATPTATSTSTPTPDPSLCNQAEFVADISYPDGSLVEMGTRFTKTWRLKNSGTCAWTADYELVFFNGSQLNGPIVQPIGREVKPGQEVDLSINLVAPMMPGEHKGSWKLREPGGQVFSSDISGFWVSILTQPKTPTPVPLPDWKTLKQGDAGVEVLAAQYLLKMYGQFLYTNGTFNELTTKAVSSFQTNKALPATGVIDNQTWMALTGTLVLREGNDSGAVLALQNLLREKGPAPLWISGVMDKATFEAIRAFQQQEKLAVTGEVSVELWQVLVSK